MQGKGRVGWLRNFLKENTGKDYRVTSIIVYPGWYVRRTAKGTRVEVVVLNPKALPTFLDKSRNVLAAQETHFIKGILGRYVRANETSAQ